MCSVCLVYNVTNMGMGRLQKNQFRYSILIFHFIEIPFQKKMDDKNKNLRIKNLYKLDFLDENNYKLSKLLYSSEIINPKKGQL